MGFNVFKDQIDLRKEWDQKHYETALDELISILDEGVITRQTAVEFKDAFGVVLKHLKQPMPQIPEEIEDPQKQLTYLLRVSGVMKRTVELSGDWWKRASGVFLGRKTDGKVVAIFPSGFRGFSYRDSEGGTAVKINAETASALEPTAHQFYKPFPAKKITPWELIKFALQSFERSDLFFLLAVSAMIALFGLFYPYMNQVIFNDLIPSSEKGEVFPIAVLLLGILSGAAVFGIARSMLITRLRDKINIAVQNAVMMRIISLPTSFFRDYSAGELSARIGGINTLFVSLSDSIITAALTVAFSFIYLFQMNQFAPSLVRPGLLSIAALLGVTILTTIIQSSVSRRQLELSTALSGYTSAMFSGIQKIKSSGAEKRAFYKWAAGYKKEGRLLYLPPLFLRIQPAVAMLVLMLGNLLLYVQAARNGVSQADYIAFVLAYGMVTGALMALNGIAIAAANLKPLLDMIRPILDEIPETAQHKKIVTSLSGNFEMSHVTFRYSQDLAPVLSDVSFKVRSGEYVAIVGKTGSGKSTLLRLLLGFESPETGAIYYDGQDLSGLDLTSTRQCIGVDLQNGKLFPGDIYANIVLTAPWKTMEDAWEAAKMAGIDEEIKAMPMGMHTILSEGSGGISGGQKQRLLIARALITKPKILFFDEATSALDNLSQKHVSESIAALKCTRLVIAHRLSTIQNCDRILMIENGKIAEEGTYASLMEQKGRFYQLVNRQTL